MQVFDAIKVDDFIWLILKTMTIKLLNVYNRQDSGDFE